LRVWAEVYLATSLTAREGGDWEIRGRTANNGGLSKVHLFRDDLQAPTQEGIDTLSFRGWPLGQGFYGSARCSGGQKGRPLPLTLFFLDRDASEGALETVGSGATKRSTNKSIMK